MTTAAQRRKHAEKIQKDALQVRLDAVQPLIDDLSKREALTEKIAALQSEITTFDISIGTHYRAALDGGWTADELVSANLNVPKSATGKRAPKPRKIATPNAAATASADAVRTANANANANADNTGA